jgi:hypothetical protein
LGAVTLAALAAGLELRAFAAAAFLGAIATGIAARPPSARHLLAIGVALTVASVSAGGLIIACT